MIGPKALLLATTLLGLSAATAYAQFNGGTPGSQVIPGTSSGGGGGGGVTGVSVAMANGLAGTSSGGAAPILTLTTSVTGVLKGNGTAISAATAGTDYLSPSVGATVSAAYTFSTGLNTSGITNASGSIVTFNSGLGNWSYNSGVMTSPRLTLSVAQTVSGSFAGSQAPLYENSSFSGTATDTYRNLNYILIQSDNISDTGNIVQGFAIADNFGGTSMTGGRIAFAITMSQSAATANTTSTFYQGGQISATASFKEPNSTGTGFNTAQGVIFALSGSATLAPGATDWSGVAGFELDTIVAAQPYSVLGISAVRSTGGYSTFYQASEPSQDVAYKIGCGLSSECWLNGYSITSTGGNYALDPTNGQAFIVFPGKNYATNPAEALNGINLSYVQFSGNAWYSQGASIDGSGNGILKSLGIGNWTETYNSTGLTIDAPNQIALTVAIHSGGGGTGYSTNEQFTFASNGIGIVTSQSSGVVTGISVLQYPTSASPSCSSGCATTSRQFSGAGQTTGSGLTLDLTWTTSGVMNLGTTSASAINIGNTSATTTIGGSLVASDLSGGTQVSCLGLTSGNVVVGNGNACSGVLTVSAVTSNASIGVLPSTAKIRAIYVKETAGNAPTGGLNFGTSSGGSQIVSSAPLAASGTTSMSPGLGGIQEQQIGGSTVYVDASNWNGASVNVQIDFDAN